MLTPKEQMVLELTRHSLSMSKAVRIVEEIERLQDFNYLHAAKKKTTNCRKLF